MVRQHPRVAYARGFLGEVAAGRAPRLRITIVARGLPPGIRDRVAASTLGEHLSWLPGRWRTVRKGRATPVVMEVVPVDAGESAAIARRVLAEAEAAARELLGVATDG